MTAKIKGRVKGAFEAAVTEKAMDLNKVQDSETALSKEVWEIPDKKIKGESFFEKRTNTSKRENIFSKEGKLFLAERSITPKEKSSLQTEGSEKTQKGRSALDLNDVQKSTLANYSSKAERETDGDEEDNKEIAFFTEPKSVKRKTQRHIFAFQAISAAAVCLIMLLLKLFALELYDNLHLYYFRLFQW